VKGTSNDNSPLAPVGTRQLRTGLALSGVAVAFLVFDSVGKLLKVAPVVAGTAELGYPESVIRLLGLILLTCVVVYVIPRSAVFGAILLTGYPGAPSRRTCASAALC
jgi:hypothetical protein